MAQIEFDIRRPNQGDWARILEILETANFHHIGGREMPSFPLEDCFIAVSNGLIVGVAGYRILSATTAKTTLLVVDPAFRGRTIGVALHRARQEFLRSGGIKTLHTNVDDERAVKWYARHFGYRPTGKRLPKVEPFGRSDTHEWTGIMVEL